MRRNLIGLLMISVLLLILSYGGTISVHGQTPSATPFGGGGKIAFSRFEHDGSNQIWVMNSDGSHQTNLSNNAYIDSQPTWSPDGKHIAYISYRGDSVPPQLYIMNADGSHQTNVSRNNNFTYADPAWSPDGKHIAFTLFYGSQRLSQIHIMNPDGSSQINLSRSARWDQTPSWSPDSKHILFGAYSDGQIYVMNAYGSYQTKLTKAGNYNSDPVWSPDGKSIAYTGNGLLGRQIFVMDASGSIQINMLIFACACGEHPTWSPDGKHIAFGNNGVIAVMDANGLQPTKLTSDEFDSNQPAWSPSTVTN